MKIKIYDGLNAAGDVSVSKLFDESSEKVLHQVVVARLANDRAGTLNTKTKSEVNGGGKKPWRQKGLGRARSGSSRSPLWKGGGVTFGPKPRSFAQQINKKMKANAYLYAFKKLNEAGALKAVSDFQVSSLKTKDFKAALAKYVDNMDQRIVVITEKQDANLVIGSRNLPKVVVMNVNTIDILPLVYATQVIITEAALKALDDRFTKVLK